MLRHLKLYDEFDQIQDAIINRVSKKYTTAHPSDWTQNLQWQITDLVILDDLELQIGWFRRLLPCNVP